MGGFFCTDSKTVHWPHLYELLLIKMMMMTTMMKRLILTMILI